jgi:hypothetical protein
MAADELFVFIAFGLFRFWFGLVVPDVFSGLARGHWGIVFVLMMIESSISRSVEAIQGHARSCHRLQDAFLGKVAGLSENNCESVEILGQGSAARTPYHYPQARRILSSNPFVGIHEFPTSKDVGDDKA